MNTELLRGLRATATMSVSKSDAARRMMSMCPLVGGSKDPAYTATRRARRSAGSPCTGGIDGGIEGGIDGGIEGDPLGGDPSGRGATEAV